MSAWEDQRWNYAFWFRLEKGSWFAIVRGGRRLQAKRKLLLQEAEVSNSYKFLL